MPTVDQEVQPEVIEEQVQATHAAAHRWIHQPAPCNAGDDKRDCHGKKEDIAKDRASPLHSVDQDSHEQPKQQANGKE